MLTYHLQVRVSAVLTNAPYILNLDCDHYVNNSKAIREAMCFLMDPQVGRDVCYVQFPQRFDGIDRSDRYANRNTVFFDVSSLFFLVLISRILVLDVDLFLCQLYARVLLHVVHVVGAVFLVAFRRSPPKNSLRFNVIPKEKI